MTHRHEDLKNGLTGERISWELQRSFYSFLRSPVLAVIPLQIGALLFVSAKGAGKIYLDMLPLLLFLTLLSGFLVCLIHGNQKILILSLILLTVGTMLQSLFKEEQILKNSQEVSEHSVTGALQAQYLIGMIAACAIGFLYWNLRECSKMKLAEFLTVFAVIISIGTILLARSVGNTKNWISIGGVSIQTTELVKLIYLFIAAILLGTVEKPDKKRLIGFFVVSFLLMGFLVIQSEFGTLLLLLMVFLTFLFMFVPDLKVFIATVLSLSVLCSLAVFTGRNLKKLAAAGSIIGNNPFSRIYLSNYQKIANRVIYWMHPEKDADGLGYQLLKAKESIVSGGWFGTSSVTDLPVKTSDLVFPALIQRCGMVFALLVFLVFILLWLEGMKICVKKEDKYHRMMAVGLISMFLDQTIIIIAGSTGLCPLTGITLPFISSGGTSIVVSFMQLSVLLCISGNISWKGQRSEEIEFFEKSTDRAGRLVAFGYRHVRCFVQNIGIASGSVKRSRSGKGRCKTGRI